MSYTRYRSAGLALVCAVMLSGSVAAQQQHQQHHPGGSQASPPVSGGASMETPPSTQTSGQTQGMMEDMQGMMGQAETMSRGGMIGRRGLQAPKKEDEEEETVQRGMMGRDMMGSGGMIMQHLERLARQLELTDTQRAQTRPLLGNHAKDIVRLQAEIDTIAIDLRQLLEIDPVDLSKGKQLLQAIAGKEADLRLAHLTAMQEISKILTPEQQQKFRAMRNRMMGHGEMMAR